MRDGQGQDGLSNTELKTGKASIIMEGRLYESGNELDFDFHVMRSHWRMEVVG